MYDGHFGFQRRPFASIAQVDQYFPGAAIENARATLARCIERGEGVGVVFGPSGTGKTLLCQVLAEQFKGEFRVAMLSAGRLSSRRNLFQAILYDLGRPYRGMDEGELRLALLDYLVLGEDCPQNMLLLVDEAHTLPLRLLDELRMLTNTARGGQPCMRLVLAGASILEERFATPKLDSFNQRLAARCYLEPLNRTEVQDYIGYQVALARGEDPAMTRYAVEEEGQEIFSAEVCQSVFHATDGVPRLVNQVCDHALLLAYVRQRRQLRQTDIEEAWADLQQLPAPCSEETEAAGGHGVIEFGGLDDSPTDDDLKTTEMHAAQKYSVTSLRISPETDQNEDASDDPLRRIEHLLANVDEEFQPAGSIRPEVELVFEDPFDEEFEREEIITDRCSRRRQAGLAGPDPTCCRPTDASYAETEAESWSLEEESAAAGPNPDDRQTAAASCAGSEGSPVRPAAARHKAELGAAAARPRASIEMKEPDDKYVLVVEEGYDEATPAHPVVAVRHREYGRLFAKLRRG